MNTVKVFHDQLGREIKFSFPPQRIISLVPSQTELLFDLGLDDEIVGITKFCIHPENKCRKKTKIGGTKNLNLNKIHSIQPDLIIGNKEENEVHQMQQLMLQRPVWVSDVKTLDDAYEMMLVVGEMVGRSEKAGEIVSGIKSSFSEKKNKFSSNILNNEASAAYLIWRNPYLTIGSDTFINAMLEIAGFKNVFADAVRYPEISVDDLALRAPQYILLASEPYPFRQKHAEELQPLLPASKMVLVDGEMFSWYGSRLLKAADYFGELRELL